MSVWADTPRWERHGHVWGHLISDASLAELHETARRAELPPRSFDLDHYDWPEAARPALIAAGVRFVGNAELTRILIASGLRIPARDRAAARRERTERAARELGLPRAPRDLISGPLGHVDPLPQLPGAFRLTREQEHLPPRIEAHDAAGRRAAQAWLEEADRRSRERGGRPWTGQAMDVPPALRP